jgi:hypothetical protein
VNRSPTGIPSAQETTWRPGSGPSRTLTTCTPFRLATTMAVPVAGGSGGRDHQRRTTASRTEPTTIPIEPRETRARGVTGRGRGGEVTSAVITIRHRPDPAHREDPALDR